MNAKHAFKDMIVTLNGLYDLREAEQIAKIYFEDAFNLKFGFRDVNLDGHQVKRYEDDLKRLLGKEPIAYVTGKSIFYGYPYELNEHVLIPRPETEELVFWIESDLGKRSGLNILDIGTGSGIIAISLAKLRRDWSLSASDISKDALKVAQLNASLNEVEVTFIYDDILDENSKIAFHDYDVIVSNPPYIAIDEKSVMSDSTLQFEPDLALYGEDDGLNFYRVFAEKLISSDQKPLVLYLELNEFKAEKIQAIFNSQGLTCEIKKDMQGKARMMKVFN